MIDYHRCFNNYDEFTHWGPFVKEMFNSDTFYSVSDADFYHKEYPPFFSLVELLGCFISWSFSESVSVFSLHLFSYSLVGTYVAEHLKKDKWTLSFLKTGFILGISILVNLAFDNERVFNALYTDYSLGLFFAYTFLLIDSGDYLQSRFSYLNLVVALFALAISKQIALAYILILLFYLFITTRYTKKNLLKLLLLFLIPFASLLIWKVYITPFNLSGQFDMNYGVIIEELFSGVTYSINGNNYFSTLLTRNLTSGILSLSFPVSVLLVCFAFVIAYKLKALNHPSRMILTYAIGIGGYVFLLYILYSYCFSVSEMQSVASFVRYMGSFIAGLLIVLISMMEMKLAENDRVLLPYLIGFAVFTLFMIKPYNLTAIAPQSWMKNPSSKQYRDFVKRAEEENLDKILVSSSSYGYNILKYYGEEGQFKKINKKTDIYSYDYLYCFSDAGNTYTDKFNIEAGQLYAIDSVNQTMILID